MGGQRGQRMSGAGAGGWGSAWGRVEAAWREARERSPDPRRPTAAVLFSESGEELLSAFNAPVAPGLIERDPSRLSSPEKYFWIEHAERALMQMAARRGVATEGLSVGCSLFPCVDCARALAGCGIKRLLAPPPDFSDPRWGEEFKRAWETLMAAGVEVELVASGLALSAPLALAAVEGAGLATFERDTGLGAG